MNTALIDTIDALLPQTQCGKCGHDGCLPYAQGIAAGEAINKCPPGGQATVTALADLLARPEPALAEAAVPAQVAVIREAECIGCTKCIQACPLDAIVGAAKLMHTVIAAECSGCELCVAPCPVDCIDILVLKDAEAEVQRARAAQFRQRHRARQRRLARDAARRREERQAQPRAAVAQNTEPAPQADALKKARITASMARVALGKAERQLALHGTEALQQQVERLRAAHQEADEALRRAKAEAPLAAPASDAGADRKRATIAAALARSQLAKAQRAFGTTPDEHQRNQLQELEAAVARAEQALAAPTDGEARLRQAKQAYKAARDALRDGEREAGEDLPALRDALARAEQALHAAEEHSGKPAPQLQRHDKRPVSAECRQAKTTLAYARAELARLRRDGAAAEALSAAEQRLQQAQREVDALERPT